MRRLAEAVRRKHLALAAERTYCAWLRRYCDFLTGLPLRMPREHKLELFLTVPDWNGGATSAQNQAFNAIICNSDSGEGKNPGGRRLGRAAGGWSVSPNQVGVQRRQRPGAARAMEGGGPSPAQTDAGPQSGCNRVASNHQRAHGGARTLSKGVKKLSSNFRILASALARASGASSNTSRVKVTKGICV